MTGKVYTLAILFGLTASAVVAGPADAVELALADARQQPNRTSLRYIWVRGDARFSGDDIRVVSYAMNLISRSPLKYRPVPIANDKAIVLRIDTNLYATAREIDSFRTAWEDLRFDPKFSGLVTQGALKLANIDPDGVSNKITFRDGFAYIQTEKASDVLKRDGVLRYRPPHVGDSWDVLSNLLHTESPVIDHYYFIFRSMLAVRDAARPLYDKVFGGRYYDLAGIPGGGKNDLETLLKSLGVGDGKNFRQIFEDLRSDQRAAMWRSNVTSRMRLVEVFKTLAGRESQGIFSLTSDFGEADIDVDQNPIANLLKVNKIKAHEAIWERTNGLHGFSLYDANFKRQDSVPDDVAKDHLASTPHSGRLQPAFSCVRCHGKEDGWQPVPNDVKKMLMTRKVDIFGDLTRRDQQDAIDRILSLYMGSFDTVFRRGRDDYAVNIMAVTGPWAKSKDQLDIVKQTARHMEDMIDRYWHKQIGPAEALAELGQKVKGGDAADQFAAYVLQVSNQAVLEDSRVAALRAGLKINRSEFDLVFGFIAK